MRRGVAYRLADFIGRSIPKRGRSDNAALFAHDVVGFVKSLDDFQERNSQLTFTVHAGDALHQFYRGAPLFWILPGQRHMRIGLHRAWKNETQRSLLKLIKSGKKNGLFSDALDAGEYWLQWRLGAPELDAIVRFLENLPVDTAATSISDASHPRNFSSEIRQLAYSEFERSGKFCPGAPALGLKRHKVDFEAGDRVEYDHILPYSKGGATTAANLQVLCSRCNNAKRARTL